jgi:hypothetical protein
MSKFKILDKVYFGRGPMEFVGTVIDLTEVNGSVRVQGVPTGFNQQKQQIVEIKSLEHLHIISDAEFAEQTKNEPAFAPVDGWQMIKDEWAEAHKRFGYMDSWSQERKDQYVRDMKVQHNIYDGPQPCYGMGTSEDDSDDEHYGR